MVRQSSKIQSTFVKGITHRKLSNESFKLGASSQSYGLKPSDLLQRDNYSSKLRQRITLQLTWKKKVVRTVKYPIKVNVWHCFSSKGFGRIVSFKQNPNTEFMCDNFKRSLLLTARKQFSHDSTLWKLQEDNDRKHT